MNRQLQCLILSPSPSRRLPSLSSRFAFVQFLFKRRNSSFENEDQSIHVLPGLAKGKMKRRQLRSRHQNLPEVKGEILFGIHPVYLSLLSSKRKNYFQLHVSPQFFQSDNAICQKINEFCEQRAISIYSHHKAVLSQLCAYRQHQGICLDASRLEPDKFDPETANVTGNTVWLLLHQVQDPMNLGAILRSAYYLGVNRVFVSNQSAALTPVVCKASAGALELLPICKLNSDFQFVSTLKDKGWTIIGTSSDSHSAPIASLPSATTKRLIIMGNEGSGIPERIKQKCDYFFHIRHSVTDCLIDSLNVSVATAITLTHLSLAQPCFFSHPIVQPVAE